ncbi:MAG: tagaturonate epimerase family protein [Ignavibacteriaceae bacterium]|nr:tagaturonate epimerase family protein [Ignavibacteriaceae bacterium]
MELTKYSIGVGDRFAHQAKAQLLAIIKAEDAGVLITPVWNKSFREHQIIKSRPGETRREVDSAVKSLKWKHPYFVDADHVGFKTIDHFINSCDFYTLDVADFIGKKTDDQKIKSFVYKNRSFCGTLDIPGLTEKVEINETMIFKAAEKFLFAVEEAGKVYRHLLEKKGNNNFVVEISMDETDDPQTPIELLFILSAIAYEEIPVQTIAPKFSGRFNKGVDYVGDVAKFSKEFEEDVAIIKYAVEKFHLPKNLKLSVHSGSDKFSIYKSINTTIKKYDAGVHLKTAGTTWLEELIGLASCEGEGLQIAKEIYRIAYDRYDELCGPYKTVIDIDKKKLPDPKQVDIWSGEKYASTLRHNKSNKEYNLNFRQLLHVGYKVASEMGDRYLNALDKYEDIIAKNVIENLYDRHIKKIYF